MPTTVTLTRTLAIPDPLRVARCRKVPELGPRILFFSGGSALRELSRCLIEYTHNSVHLITPFDSGGSSAEIRRVFGILSVGDLRNRLMALADQSVRGNPAIYALFAHRLPAAAGREALRGELERLAQGRHPLVLQVPNPMRRIIRNHLHYFLERMPGGFDLRGASIGNLILAGGYLNNRQHIDPVIYMFSKLVEARGVVRPITGLSYHLAARLRDGRLVAGQHRLTGKALPGPRSRIAELFLIKDLDDPAPVEHTIKPKIRELILGADLICFPYGSFYTSLIANFLPRGVGRAVRDAPCPKVYIPNPIEDPEQRGLGLYESVSTLLGYLKRDLPDGESDAGLLDVVLLDSAGSVFPQPHNLQKLRRAGLQIIDAPLMAARGNPRLDAEKVASVLLSLV